MVKQYPDTITITNPVPLTKDADNNWIESATVPTAFTSKCRAELNVSSATTSGADGQEVIYSYKIYLPKATFKGAVNAKVLLQTDGDFFNLRVIRWRNHQLNSQAWL